MALSDILKEYGDTTGIMQQPYTPPTAGIVPYKSVASSYPVYNKDTDTLEDQQTFNYEPVGIMAQPEDKPVGINPPFMPDMGIPFPEPKAEQPFVTGPTGVISYGTTEEGTPRVLTDYRTGEMTYADTGEPYVPPTGEEEEAPIGPEEGIIPCDPGYVYDPITSSCVKIDTEKTDKLEFVNRPRDIGATAKATTSITKAIKEQGLPAYGEDANYTIDNSTFLSNFGLIGKLVDDVLIKGPADDRLLQFGKYTTLPTEGINVTKNADGTLNANITEQGKINFGNIQTDESLRGNLATTQKTDRNGNIIMAPNNTPMIVGPIKINSFGKQTDRVLSQEEIDRNKAEADRKAKQAEDRRKGIMEFKAPAKGTVTSSPIQKDKDKKDTPKYTGPSKSKDDIEKELDNALKGVITEKDKQAAKKTTGGNANKSDKGKIVCTMMNESYGFGSFRNKVWLAHSAKLSKEYEVGYHALFLPLVKYAKQKGFTNNIVKNALEHIARHRTVDIRKQQYNKVDVLGRTYRTILEPLCYITGRIKLWKKK
jgi:hypothetical protein